MNKQEMIDKIAEMVMNNPEMKASMEAFLQNAGYIGRNAISFESIYERIMMQMMSGSHGAVGAALNAEREIVESIEGVEYEYPCYCCDDDSEDDEDDCDEYDEDDDEDDDEGSFPSGVYFIRKVD